MGFGFSNIFDPFKAVGKAAKAIGKAAKSVITKPIEKAEDMIVKNLLTMLINYLLGVLSPETLKKFADKVLDFVEDHVASTETELDDKIVLPICRAIRNAFGIEDND